MLNNVVREEFLCELFLVLCRSPKSSKTTELQHEIFTSNVLLLAIYSLNYKEPLNKLG